MPSRGVVAVVVALWLGAMAWLGYREVWVKYVTDAPPSLAVDLADEATQIQAPTRWVLLRNGKPIGQATTRMAYHGSDDTFELHNELKKVELTLPILFPLTVAVTVPSFESSQRMTRAGELREMTARSKLGCAVQSGGITLYRFDLTSDVRGVVVNDRIEWDCEFEEPSVGKFRPEVAPTPVPSGGALNPLQPLNRIRGLRPGQRWELTLVDPLGDAIATSLPKMIEKMTRDAGGEPLDIRLPVGAGTKVLRAKVSAELHDLTWDDQTTKCRVIEYHSGDTLVAKTWVEESTAKVLRQEAFQMGEQLTLQREDISSRVTQP